MKCIIRRVLSDPGHFACLCALPALAQDDAERLRQVFDGLLAEYPLCYGASCPADAHMHTYTRTHCHPTDTVCQHIAHAHTRQM